MSSASGSAGPRIVFHVVGGVSLNSSVIFVSISFSSTVRKNIGYGVRIYLDFNNQSILLQLCDLGLVTLSF